MDLVSTADAVHSDLVIAIIEGFIGMVHGEEDKKN